jgi:hypothetical protein
MPLNKVPKLQRDVRFRQIGDEGVLVKQDDGDLIVVNQVGVDIIQLLQDGKSFSEIVDYISRNYDIDAKTAENDAMEFIDEIEAAGIIE